MGSIRAGNSGSKIPSEDQGGVTVDHLPLPSHEQGGDIDSIRCHSDWSRLSLPRALLSFAL